MESIFCVYPVSGLIQDLMGNIKKILSKVVEKICKGESDLVSRCT